MRSLMLLLLALLCSACGFSLKENKAELEAFNQPKKIEYNQALYPVSINNLKTGKTFEDQQFKKPPQRLVCVWQNSIETPIALGVGDRIIAGMGVHDKKYLKKEYQKQYSKIPITSLENLDQESVLMMEPDMIIGWYSTFTAKYLRSTDFWHKRGVGTYIAVSSAWLPNGQILENEFNDILNLGKVFDRREAAEKIVSDMKQQIAKVSEETKNVKNKPRALIMGGMGRQLGVYGDYSLAGDLVKRLNGELLCPKERTISAEEVVNLDPDTIFYIIGESRYQEKEQLINNVYNHPGFKNLKCVRNRRVFALPLNAIYTPGVRVMDGISIIAHGLYPDLYTDESGF